MWQGELLTCKGLNIGRIGGFTAFAFVAIAGPLTSAAGSPALLGGIRLPVQALIIMRRGDVYIIPDR